MSNVCLGADNDQQVFNSYLLTINKALSFAQFELRGCRNQYDGRVYYGLVNNVSDDQSKLGTKYSVPQIALFKAIVREVLQPFLPIYCSDLDIDQISVK